MATRSGTVVTVSGTLVELLGQPRVEVVEGRRRSVKDLAGSVGIPHPEIDRVHVDGVSVGFDHVVGGGEHVHLDPPEPHRTSHLWPPPPEPRRFVLDVHLGTLARRLRTLGFDSWYRNDADDAQLAAVSASQGRILLTRDRQLLMRRVVRHGYHPRSTDPDEQLREVVVRYVLAARRRPLSRCTSCNGTLEPVAAGEVADRVPRRSSDAFDRFARCRACGQVFWPGSHVEALARRLGGLLVPLEDHDRRTGPPYAAARLGDRDGR